MIINTDAVGLVNSNPLVSRGELVIPQSCYILSESPQWNPGKVRHDLYSQDSMTIKCKAKSSWNVGLPTCQCCFLML